MAWVDGIYGGAYDGRVFVLTHQPPDDSQDSRISFISDGIEAAVATAQAAAGDKDAGSSPPASAASACRPGSLMRSLSTWPQVLLGGGVRLYGEKRDGSVELERISLGEAEQLTDLRFRILK